MRRNEVKAKLQRGELALGTLVFEFKTSGIGTIASNSGADFVLYDTEHTGWGWETIASVIASSAAAAAVPLVRVPVTERSYISRPLDLGAMGLMIPMVESADQAEQVVQWAKYPPRGVRGAAFGVAHDGYKGEDHLATMSSANEETLLIGQIETAEGVSKVGEIAAVEGLDVLWVGHFDLTNSMGIPGQFEHPDFVAALESVSKAASSNGKSAGFMVSSVEEAHRMIDLGFRCLGYSGDLWIYGRALREGISKIRDAQGLRG
ncbi:MAG TPA: aldolase/citrate lyase family protein [Candidatus Acidoferrales bacterium]|nr:aldolase/citrate lyase family protein [Candidatus Acidoferrales bacterium]